MVNCVDGIAGSSESKDCEVIETGISSFREHHRYNNLVSCFGNFLLEVSLLIIILC